MKTARNVRLAIMTAMAGVLGTSAHAETVATAPVGAMSYTFPANAITSVGVPLLRPAVWSGIVTSGSSNTVTLSGAALNLSSYINQGVSYFIEIVGHSDGTTNAYIGDRFEVDEAATRAAANAVLSIDLSSNLNTATGGLGGLVGYRIVIRPHWTLATLFGTGTSATELKSAVTFLTADQVLAWDGLGWTVFWFRQNSSGTVKEWRNTATGTANCDHTIIPPGSGVYFRNLAQPKSITLTGDVRTNRFIRNLDSATHLIALGYPVDRSPNQLNFSPANNFTAAGTFLTADQIFAWDGLGFSIYWLRRNSAGDVFQWRNTATQTTDHSNTPFIRANEAFFIRPVGTPNDIIQMPPFTS